MLNKLLALCGYELRPIRSTALRFNDFDEPMARCVVRLNDEPDGTVVPELGITPELHLTEKEGKPFVTNAQKATLKLYALLKQQYGA